jgi:hypothetical protein
MGDGLERIIMEGLIKWVLIGGAVYVVGRELGFIPGGSLFGTVQGTSQGVIATGTTTPPLATATPTTTQSGATPVAPLYLTDVNKAKVITAASNEGTMQRQGGKLGFDQWNYFAATVGIPNVDWERTPASKNDRSTLYDIDTYWGFLKQGGLSGMGMLYEHPIVQNHRSGGAMWFERADKRVNRRLM